MDRVNAVICHPLYLEYYHRLERAEKEKRFNMKKKFPMRLRESGSPGKYWIHFRKKRDFLRKKKER